MLNCLEPSVRSDGYSRREHYPGNRDCVGPRGIGEQLTPCYPSAQGVVGKRIQKLSPPLKTSIWPMQVPPARWFRNRARKEGGSVSEGFGTNPQRTGGVSTPVVVAPTVLAAGRTQHLQAALMEIEPLEVTGLPPNLPLTEKVARMTLLAWYRGRRVARPRRASPSEWVNRSSSRSAKVRRNYWFMRHDSMVKRYEFYLSDGQVVGIIVQEELVRSGVEQNPGPQDPTQKQDRRDSRGHEKDVRRSARGDRHVGKGKKRRDNDTWLDDRSRALTRQEIASALIRAGVEENPGPSITGCLLSGKNLMLGHVAVEKRAGGYCYCKWCGVRLEKLRTRRGVGYHHSVSEMVADDEGSSVDLSDCAAYMIRTPLAPSAPPMPEVPPLPYYLQQAPPTPPVDLPPPISPEEICDLVVAPGLVPPAGPAPDVPVEPSHNPVHPGKHDGPLPLEPGLKCAKRASNVVLSGRLVTQAECRDRNTPLVDNWVVTGIVQLVHHFEGETRVVSHRNVDIVRQDFVLQSINLEAASSLWWMRIILAAVYGAILLATNLHRIPDLVVVNHTAVVAVVYLAMVAMGDRVLHYITVRAESDSRSARMLVGLLISYTLPGYLLLKTLVSFADEVLFVGAAVIYLFGRNKFKDNLEYAAAIGFMVGSGVTAMLFPGIGHLAASAAWKYTYYLISVTVIELLYQRKSRVLYYCPHMATAVLSESYTGALPDRKEIRQKLMRLACLPVPDEYLSHILDGTEEMIECLMRKDFRVAPALNLTGTLEDVPLE